ncbi:sugar phosphate isomerase/epimerase [Dyadobacter chenwenxiniae]|uniref:Sugar phosphate isomerase/epimerase n=1 Tax=Dyadobacter chenwenxiniae TaxID=2906456 RepID=A0A9X1PLH3_9BACT|nr:TIM barrel protein [Dyadobacter chenwenxiniae]MCF0062600.1 sugar phosphate isomerase/epimerase [Dyadobacter chenwenxiniae]UON83653.1 sugar phosphate isomerase/epimerase [Dyadobacter chenwenxiniae]
MDRRKFMGSAMATAGMLTGFEAVSVAEKAPAQFANKLSLKILGTNWGFTGTTDAFCAEVKKEGYDGIEMWWPATKEKQKELFTALKKHGLDVGLLCGSGEKDYAAHLDAFKKQIDAATTQFEQKPLYVNCHSGKDFFTYDQNKAFIDHTTAATLKTGIPIYHETHRGRMLFAAHIARNFIEKNPDLRLTLDISHWCNVHESLLADQQETIQLALSRVGHIHSRIGHEEGPQVNDPRAPEWEAAVKAHLAWWDTVVEHKVKSGETLTVLTEFGPPNYLPTVPFTHQPLADQWGINVHMMHLLRKRYLA